MNIHLLPDDKFSEAAVHQFEFYFPGQNLYISWPITRSTSFKYIHDMRVKCIDYSSECFCKELSGIINLEEINNVFVHYLDEAKSKAANELKKITGCRCYWIFYGGDLYSVLYKRNSYPLYDDFKFYDIIYKAYWKVKTLWKKLVNDDYFENFLQICDYICYWDKYDYELLKKYYDIKAKFRFFAYYTPETVRKEDSQFYASNKQYNLILVGNNSNRNGNIITILKRIKEIDKNQEMELLLPLSYGYPSEKKRIINYLKTNFQGRYTILDSFIPYQEYMALITKANSAIFGQHRQAAGGNIFTMVKAGAKVFLREDNNVLQLLRDEKCIVYSFEEDMNCIDILKEPLTEEAKDTNKNNCVLNNLSEIAGDYMLALFQE